MTEVSKNIDVFTMVKGDLHVHLNGLVSIDVVKQVLINEKVKLNYEIEGKNGIIKRKPSSLNEYLKAWEVLRLIPSNRLNLKILVDSAFLNLKKDNVQFAEIRNSILYIALLNNVAVDVALGWLIEDMEESAEKYGIDFGLIMSIPRGDYSSEHFSSLLKAYKKLNKPKSIIGLDLSGNENIVLPKHVSEKFANAKSDFGLNITIHAGETGNIENVIRAITEFKADRIGHGTVAGKHPEVMDMLREKNICLEVCPISNKLTGAIVEGEKHPMLDFLKYKVPFVLCSDNPLIHQLSLSHDYIEFLNVTKNYDYINSMLDMQKQYSFL